MSTSQAAGGQVNFSIVLNDDTYDWDTGDSEGMGVAIYVDWNNDLDFDDANEQVYTSNSYLIYDANGVITVPVGTANGNYRMRLRVDYDSMNPAACGTAYYGEAEDYTFKVVSVPTCYVPTSVTATSATVATADLSWAAPTTAPVPSGYQYAVTTSATPPASGTAVTATSVTGYSGLTINTTYYLHVRSNWCKS